MILIAHADNDAGSLAQVHRKDPWPPPASAFLRPLPADPLETSSIRDHSPASGYQVQAPRPFATLLQPFRTVLGGLHSNSTLDKGRRIQEIFRLLPGTESDLRHILLLESGSRQPYQIPVK